MHRTFTLGLIALVLGVGLIALIETEPGYVLITYGDVIIETSLWVHLALVATVVLLLYGAVSLINALMSGPKSLSSWLGWRRSRQAAQLTTRGLISFIEGDWSRARSQLVKGAAASDAPLVNYLGAARASHRMNEPDQVSEYLAQADAAEPEASVAVSVTRAELLLQAGNFQQAVASLEQVPGNAARRPQVVGLLLQAYLGLEDWSKLAALLPEAKRSSVLPAHELLDLERRVYLALLRSCAGRTDGGVVESLRQQWQQLPAELKRDEELLHTYVGALVEAEAHAAAEKVILKSQKQRWDSGLARWYGYVASGSPARQLANAEAWLAQHEDDAQLQLCLGRLSARCELWGKAREYFENSYKLERSAEVCAELGRLLAAQGQERPAAAYYREGLALEEAQLPDIPLPVQSVPGGQRLQQPS